MSFLVLLLRTLSPSLGRKKQKQKDRERRSLIPPLDLSFSCVMVRQEKLLEEDRHNMIDNFSHCYTNEREITLAKLESKSSAH